MDLIPDLTAVDPIQDPPVRQNPVPEVRPGQDPAVQPDLIRDLQDRINQNRTDLNREVPQDLSGQNREAQRDHQDPENLDPTVQLDP